MLNCVPFRAEHFDHYEEATEPSKGGRPSFAMLKYMQKEHSFTTLLDGKPIASGGLMTSWPGNYWAWTYLTKACGPHMLQISRFAKAGMEGVKGRISMTTPVNYKQGMRWAKLLGFEIECPALWHWGPDGADHALLVRKQV